MSFTFRSKIPGLLVSVRSPSEARAALAGGANVIDVKEPNRGSLGAADAATIAAIVGAVSGRAPVTAAMGELKDLRGSAVTGVGSIPQGVSLVKIGLAGCRMVANWQLRWQACIEQICIPTPTCPIRPVAVVYADWQAANAPDPEQVLQSALELRCPALLIDTWDKSAGSLFNHWPVEGVNDFAGRVRRCNMAVVLAGSLRDESFSLAARLGPDLVAVRSAACDFGRNGTVSRDRVKNLRWAITQVYGAERPSPRAQLSSFGQTANDFCTQLFRSSD